MGKYIDAEKLIAKIENMFDYGYYCTPKNIGKQRGRNRTCREILSIITSLQQEQSEVDLEKELKNKAELIANGIMIGVQANKYHTCIYDKASNDFNHSHLLRAALKGLELGLNARKEE